MFTQYKIGDVHGRKVKYGDSVSCSIWYITNHTNNSMDDDNTCLDFSFEDIIDIRRMLDLLVEVEADKYPEIIE